MFASVKTCLSLYFEFLNLVLLRRFLVRSFFPLTHFRPMFQLQINLVVGFYQQNVTLPQVFFEHFASKNQLPGFYVSGTLVENGLIFKISNTTPTALPYLFPLLQYPEASTICAANQSIFTCSKTTMETPEQCVKSVQI